MTWSLRSSVVATSWERGQSIRAVPEPSSVVLVLLGLRAWSD